MRRLRINIQLSFVALAALVLTVGCSTNRPSADDNDGGGGSEDGGSCDEVCADYGFAPGECRRDVTGQLWQCQHDGCLHAVARCDEGGGACGEGCAAKPDPDLVDPGPPPTFSEEALLEDLAVHVVFPVYQRMAARARTLAAHIASYCDALDDQDAKAAAQEAWRRAMETWQLAEVFQFNNQPATLEGRAQRSYVYSWPDVSPCEIDDVIAQGYAAGDFNIHRQTIDARGLWAIEYALFSDTADCYSAHADAALAEARCEYALAVAEDVVDKLGQYLIDWAPGTGTRSNDFVMAGQSGSAFTDIDRALTSLFHAMFYLDEKTRELKLDLTTGVAEVKCNFDVHPSCERKTPCPEAVESPYAQLSKEHILSNLAGFEMLFRGVTLGGRDRLGFDDFITARGGDPSEVIAAIGDSRSELQALPGTLRSVVEAGGDDAKDASEEMKNIFAAMCCDIPTVLGLEWPPEPTCHSD